MVTEAADLSSLDAYDRDRGIKSQPTTKGEFVIPQTGAQPETKSSSGRGVRTPPQPPQQ